MLARVVTFGHDGGDLRHDLVEAQVPIGGRSLGLLLVGGLGAVVAAIAGAVDGRWGTALVSGAVAAFFAWRIEVCGIVVRSLSS